MKNSLVSFKKKLIKTNVLPFVGVGFLVSLVFWVATTIVIPMAVGDGLNNYSGLKKAIAERVLRWADNSHRAQTESDIAQFHIDDIRPTTQQEIAEWCPKAEYISNDPNDPRYYSVALSTRIIGTFTVERSVIQGCMPWENDPSGGNPVREYEP